MAEKQQYDSRDREYKAWQDAIMQDDEGRLRPDHFPADYVTQLEKRAEIDPLTGVFTRGAMNERMAHLLDIQARNIGFLFLDGNQIKQINDNLSDGYGDNYIQRTAIKLRDNIDRKKTKIYRRGGDEFVVMIEGLGSQDELDKIGHRLCGIFSGGNEPSNDAVIPTVGIGGMFIGPDATNEMLEHALQYAEVAMKYTKKETAKLTDEYKTSIFHLQDETFVPFRFSPSSYQHFDAANPGIMAFIPKTQTAVVK